MPLDFEALLATSTVPLLINSCETDSHFPPEAQAVTDELLGAGKYRPGYKRTFWEVLTISPVLLLEFTLFVGLQSWICGELVVSNF